MTLVLEREYKMFLKTGQTGRAKRLRTWLDNKYKLKAEKEEAHLLWLLGDAVTSSIKQGRLDFKLDANGLLNLMSDRLANNPKDKLFVLGEDGNGSAVFHRCIAKAQPVKST